LYSYLIVAICCNFFECTYHSSTTIEKAWQCPFLRALHISLRSNASRPHRYARDSNSCVYIILRETCDKCIPLRCIRCSRVYSFLYSPDRVICHGCVSAADHLEASRYIRLISPLPSVLPALLVNSSFIHRVYVLLFVRRDARRCLSWTRFIWDCLTNRLTCKFASRIVFSASCRTDTPETHQLNMIIT